MESFILYHEPTYTNLMKKQLKESYGEVANLGCILCFIKGQAGTPCEIHHVRRLGGRRDLAPYIGLCPEHHRGNTGIHGLGNKGFVKYYNITQEELIEKTKELIGEYL